MRFMAEWVGFLAFLMILNFFSQKAYPQIVGLGDLAGGNVDSIAFGVSADGSVIVGGSSSNGFPNGGTGFEAFRWTLTDGMRGIGDLPGGGRFSSARDVSADGTQITGNSRGSNGVEAFRWSESNGLVGLGDFPEGDFHSEGNAISGYGSTIVGEGTLSVPGNGARAAMFGSGGVEDLGVIDRFNQFSIADDVSFDGLVVVGRASGQDGNQAFRWTRETGMIRLGDFDGGEFSSQAAGVSSDGSVVVGTGEKAPIDGQATRALEAFRWTESGGLVGLGDIAGGATFSIANDVSGDGEFVVGRSGGVGGGQAFFWSEELGMNSVYDLLVENGHDVSYWASLTEAHAISADGSTIVGVGINSAGNREGFAVNTNNFVAVPEPRSIALSGLLMILAIAFIFMKRAKSNVIAQTQ